MMDQKRPLSNLVRALVIDSDHGGLDQLKKLLEATQRVEICAETTSYALAASQIDRHTPGFVFFTIGSDIEAAYTCIKKFRSNHPTLRIICIGPTNDSDIILNCFRSGADEFLVKPLSNEDVVEVLQRLGEQPKIQKQESRSIGRVIAVWGSRGGAGVTTIAGNLADNLAQSKSTVIVDLNENQGDLSLFFDLQPSFSLQDLWGSGERLDLSLVDSVTTEHESGLRLLLQPYEKENGLHNPDELSKLMLILREQYECVVLDVGHDFDVIGMLLPFIHELYLVVNQNVPSLFLATQKRKWLEEREFSMDNLFLIVNGFQHRNSVTRQHITKGIGLPISILIRHDEASVLSAMNQGIPLRKIAKRGKAHVDIERLSHQILKTQAQEGAGKGKRGLLLGSFFSRSKLAEASQQ